MISISKTLTLALLVTFRVQAINYTVAGASFNWSNLHVVNNAPVPLAVPPSAPSQVIEEVSQSYMRGYWNYTGTPWNVRTFIYIRRTSIFKWEV